MGSNPIVIIFVSSFGFISISIFSFFFLLPAYGLDLVTSVFYSSAVISLMATGMGSCRHLQGGKAQSHFIVSVYFIFIQNLLTPQSAFPLSGLAPPLP
jgi:uncharacterized membrane protein YhhN